MGNEAICDDLVNTDDKSVTMRKLSTEDKSASGLQDICTVQVKPTKSMPSAGC